MNQPGLCWLIVMGAISLAGAYPSAPGTCDASSSAVSQMASTTNSGNGGYTITTSASTYSAGGTYTITVSGSTSFKGLLLYGAGGGARVGSFTATSGFAIKTCSGGASSTIGHSNANDKGTSVSFTWTAPDPAVGDVVFSAVVVIAKADWYILTTKTLPQAAAAATTSTAAPDSTAAPSTSTTVAETVAGSSSTAGATAAVASSSAGSTAAPTSATSTMAPTTAVVFSSTLPNEQTLSVDKVVLRWNLVDGNRLDCEVQGTTTGYVALGFSSDGMMVGSEAVLGWVGTSTSILQYNLKGKSVGPTGVSAQATQNLQATSGAEVGGVTTIRFSRLLSTGDPEDRVINATADTHVIFSLGTEDVLAKHFFKGSTTVNFAAGAAKVRLTVSGDLATFNQTSFVAGIASALGVSSDTVAILSVASGSVIVDMQIKGSSTATASSVVSSLKTKVSSGDASLSALGVTGVVEVSGQTTTTASGSTPAPTDVSVGSASAQSALTGLVVLVIALVVALA
eukprot:CAMPEP_0114555372 /NCGR_PEP_ID=MMETSP0114-20121206/8715_1 /TAXON_ID=31324 /ORGANISM="Goniomonas sp, Strain m" /LENGTH=510 /DNA_ID=CAMNT_0001740495 /DNA_START=13 /DNA_END=1545 /DNA_ORIENTATION=-